MPRFGRTPRLRKWYFAVNELGLRHQRDLLRAAVISCRCNTSLEPHLLYVGGDRPELDELSALGVRIIRHRPSLEPELRIAYGDRVETFIGHWLRLDLPHLETADDFILYTDIDVLFCSMPREVEAPSLLSAGPAIHRYERSDFNSGVLIMNLPALRTVWEDFHAAVRKRLLGGKFTYPGHDQPSFNKFFGSRIDWLSEEMNWRPYWGWNPQAHIVHFHGPKPKMIRNLMRNPANEQKVPPVLRDIWHRDRPAYDRYIDLHASYSEGDAQPTGARPIVKVVPRDPGIGATRPSLSQFIARSGDRTQRLLRRFRSD